MIISINVLDKFFFLYYISKIFKVVVVTACILWEKRRKDRITKRPLGTYKKQLSILRNASLRWFSVRPHIALALVSSFLFAFLSPVTQSPIPKRGLHYQTSEARCAGLTFLTPAMASAGHFESKLRLSRERYFASRRFVANPRHSCASRGLVDVNILPAARQFRL